MVGRCDRFWCGRAHRSKATKIRANPGRGRQSSISETTCPCSALLQQVGRDCRRVWPRIFTLGLLRVVKAITLISGTTRSSSRLGHSEDATFFHAQGTARNHRRHHEGADGSLSIFQIWQSGTTSTIGRSLLPPLFARDGQLSAFQVGFVEFVQIRGIILCRLVRPEGTEERRWEEVLSQIGIIDWPAVKWMPSDVKRLGEELALLTNGMCNCSSKLACQ